MQWKSNNLQWILFLILLLFLVFSFTCPINESFSIFDKINEDEDTDENEDKKLLFDKLNIGIIGAISISKGSYLIQEMSIYIKDNLIPWNIYHIGYGFNYNLKKKNNIIKLIDNDDKGRYISEKNGEFLEESGYYKKIRVWGQNHFCPKLWD